MKNIHRASVVLSIIVGVLPISLHHLNEKEFLFYEVAYNAPSGSSLIETELELRKKIGQRRIVWYSFEQFDIAFGNQPWFISPAPSFDNHRSMPKYFVLVSGERVVFTDGSPGLWLGQGEAKILDIKKTAENKGVINISWKVPPRDIAEIIGIYFCLGTMGCLLMVISYLLLREMFEKFFRKT